MAKIKNHDEVRFVRGQTVDTGHVEGGDLRGCRARVISPPFKANGKDGPKGQTRVMVAVDDDKAPRFAGLLSAPVENLETCASSNRGASVAGFGEGTLKRDGILDIKTIKRGGRTFARTRYKDGRETLDPLD